LGVERWTFAYAVMDRHFRFSIQRVEGKFLPRGFVDREDASVLRGAILNHRNQLHISPDSRAEDDRQLESANAGEIPVRPQSAAEDHTLVEVEGLL
jgi:hypothetical protein